MTTSRAICFDTIGGPEVLRLENVDIGSPGDGEVRVRQTAVGVNFIDVYHRRGLYPIPLPSGLGLEAAGVVESIGGGVLDVAVGDRVAYCWGPIGAYAEVRIVPAARLVRLPGLVADETAAGLLLKGCTVEFLVERCARVEAGQTVLVHAAAGGVGLLLIQWLRHVGARVIGTAGSDLKAQIALDGGADDIVVASHEDVSGAIRDLTSGEGVDVVFDGVGRDTWETSLRSLKRRGLCISFGNASGPVIGIDLAALTRHGSLTVTRPSLSDYYSTREEILAGSARVFDLVLEGALEVAIGQRYSLADAATAHADLEARKTTGSTILLP